MLIFRRALCAVREKKSAKKSRFPNGPQGGPNGGGIGEVRCHPLAMLRVESYIHSICTSQVPVSIGVDEDAMVDTPYQTPLSPPLAGADTPLTALTGLDPVQTTSFSSAVSLMSPASSFCSNPGHTPPLTTPAPPSPLSLQACQRLLRRLDEIDKLLQSFNVRTQKAEDVMALSNEEKKLLLLAYNHMLDRYDNEPKWLDQDNFGRRGSGSELRSAGTQVPHYYANIHNQSIHRRKILSIAGLRNLVLFGPEIFDELRTELFSGDPSVYRNCRGVHKMRYYTGNVVDLDTTVLRTNDRATLAAVNAMNAKSKGKQYETSAAFAASPQACEIAKHAAIELLHRFAVDFGLSKSVIRKRRIDPSDVSPSSSVPVAKSNSDRGRYPLWRYVNAGQDSFHVNVPHIDDVIGALLKAPLHAARIYLRIHVEYGSSPAALSSKLDAFFTDCIADACFNQKWKAIEEFEAQMEHEGSIVDILQNIQKDHQTKLLKVMDDDDDDFSNEKALMWDLVRGRKGRDVSGTLRYIQKSDVDTWVSDPSASL